MVKIEKASKEVVYDVDWQIMRVDLLGTWTTEDSTAESIKKMKAYLDEQLAIVQAGGDHYKAEWQELARRFFRVINYMNAIRMGLSGQQRSGYAGDVLVQQFRDGLQIVAERQQVTRFGYGQMDWALMNLKLINLYGADKAKFMKIYNDLTKRKGNAIRRHDTTKWRPELIRYIDMMHEIMGVE